MIDYIWEVTESGGWILAPIFLLAVLGWWIVLVRWWVLSKMDVPLRSPNLLKSSSTLVVEWSKRLTKREANSLPGAVAKLMYSCRDKGKHSMQHTLEVFIKSQEPQLNKGLSTLANLATTAPLLGLLGTVSGMVGTFKVIKVFGTSNPAMMSESISEALMTAQNGLLVAVPLMIVHIHLVQKAYHIEKKIENVGKKMINHFHKESEVHV